MKATENQHVRSSYPSAQVTRPVGTATSAAPAARRARAVPSSWLPRSGERATSRIT